MIIPCRHTYMNSAIGFDPVQNIEVNFGYTAYVKTTGGVDKIHNFVPKKSRTLFNNLTMHILTRKGSLTKIRLATPRKKSTIDFKTFTPYTQSFTLALRRWQ